MTFTAAKMNHQCNSKMAAAMDTFGVLFSRTGLHMSHLVTPFQDARMTLASLLPPSDLSMRPPPPKLKKAATVVKRIKPEEAAAVAAATARQRGANRPIKYHFSEFTKF